VILQDSARVESEIFHKTLSVDEGASFDGQSRRSQDPMKETGRASLAAESKAKSAEVAVVAGKKAVGNGLNSVTGPA
jgi:cytoskeletal protein CcmA (bactofilin family)